MAKQKEFEPKELDKMLKEIDTAPDAPMVGGDVPPPDPNAAPPDEAPADDGQTDDSSVVDDVMNDPKLMKQLGIK